MQNLIRLKVPMGWAVTYNKFVDVLPQLDHTGEHLENWHFFTEDLLQISKLSLKKGSYYLPQRRLLIDLGWSPDTAPNGQYRLSLVFVDPKHNNVWEEIAAFSSKNRLEIRDKMEDWLEQLTGAGFNTKSKMEINTIIK